MQVPTKGPLNEAKDLVGKRIVTSFKELTRRYFANLEGVPTASEDLGWRGKLRTEIRRIGGSVETACALGAADGIVDLVGMSITAAQFVFLIWAKSQSMVQNREKRCD